MSPWPIRGSRSDEIVGRMAARQPKRALVQRPERPQRQPGDHGVGELVRRPALQVLGDDPGAAAHRKQRPLRVSRRLDRDVGGRVADPEHQHPLASEDVGGLVVVSVQLLALELVLARKRRFGPAGVPVMPIGDEHRPVNRRILGPRVTLAPADPPEPCPLPVPLPHRLDPGHLGAKPDPVAEAEVIDVGVEVPGDLEVVGVVGIVLGHREGRVGHRPPRGVDVQRAIRRRHPVVVQVAPVAPHRRALLEAVERDPARAQHLARGDPRGARPNHAHAIGHAAVPACRSVAHQFCDGSSGIRAISAYWPPLRASTSCHSAPGSSGNSSAGSGASTIHASSSSSSSSWPAPQPE
jgi:hypothetical protein